MTWAGLSIPLCPWTPFLQPKGRVLPTMPSVPSAPHRNDYGRYNFQQLTTPEFLELESLLLRPELGWDECARRKVLLSKAEVRPRRAAAQVSTGCRSVVQERSW